MNLSQTQPSVSAQTPQTFRIMAVFWTLIWYASIGFSIYTIVLNHPEHLRGQSLVVLLGALVLFCLNYHLFYLRDDNWWPMPRRRAAIYFSSQIPLLALLVTFEPNFSGLGYALLAHACTLLPWRQWIAPITGIVLVMVWSYGILADLLRGEWLSFALFLFGLAIIIGVFAAVYILAQQRAQLCELVDELRRAKSDLEASAAQTEELAALRERTRLSREMHDSIGHALVVVNVKLEAAQRLYARESRRGDAELEETRALVRETMAELRRSLADLRAPLPNHANLAAALRCTAAEIEARSTLAVNVQAPEYLRLPPETSEAFWRVGREALSNVERHAAAASASVQLEQINGKLVLRIIDDGSGIRQADLARSGHYGVMGMRERIVALGGTLQITARHEGGTIVEASVPIKTDE